MQSLAVKGAGSPETQMLSSSSLSDSNSETKGLSQDKALFSFTYGYNI